MSNKNYIFYECISREDEMDIMMREILKECWTDVVINIPNKEYLYIAKKYFAKKHFRYIEEVGNLKRNAKLPRLVINRDLSKCKQEKVNCFLFFQKMFNKEMFLKEMKSHININFITFSSLTMNEYKLILDNEFHIKKRGGELKKENLCNTYTKSRDCKFDIDLKDKHIDGKEIRKKFIETFLIADEEIDIVSPWMNDVVVNDKLIQSIESALNRNVKIKILYGFGKCTDPRNKKSDEIAILLKEKFDKYGELFNIKKSNIHYKLLLCDEKYAIAGSFNFLSYDGSDNRLEAGDYKTSKSEITNKRNTYFDF